MPKNKDLKRRVRARMSKTGESYTAARSQLLKKKRPKRPSVPATEFAALAGMSDEAVRVKTGRTWKQWVRVLDAIDATDMPHADIARHVHEQHRIPGWWAQTVTVGYERIRGLREVGQRRDGGYEVNKSKTFAVPVGRLYGAFRLKRSRDRWLPGANPKLRKATPDKSIRMTWEDGTPVEAYFTAKGAASSRVAVQHRKLAAKTDATKMKRFWAARLEALGALLASKTSKR